MLLGTEFRVLPGFLIWKVNPVPEDLGCSIIIQRELTSRIFKILI